MYVYIDINIDRYTCTYGIQANIRAHVPLPHQMRLN